MWGRSRAVRILYRVPIPLDLRARARSPGLPGRAGAPGFAAGGDRLGRSSYKIRYRRGSPDSRGARSTERADRDRGVQERSTEPASTTGYGIPALGGLRARYETARPRPPARAGRRPLPRGPGRSQSADRARRADTGGGDPGPCVRTGEYSVLRSRVDSES